MTDIQSIIDDVLALEPEPLARHVMARMIEAPAQNRHPDLLDGPGLLQQPQVARVLVSQWTDGSWGRFHSMDTTRKQFPKTTESAIRLLLALGLTVDDAPLSRARTYLEQILRHEVAMRDPAEPNERWPIGAELFAASCLALIDPANPLLDAPIQRWVGVVSLTFTDGTYQAAREVEAQRVVHGLSGELYYLHLSNRYTAELLGARPDSLDPSTREAYGRWLCETDRGIGYLGVPIAQFAARTTIDAASRRELPRWFESVPIVTRLRAIRRCSSGIQAWLFHQQGEGGLWDFGPVQLPRISSSWRKPINRRIDHTLHVLCVLHGLESLQP